VRSRLRTALELARLSNAPTVVSNVLAGAALGGLAVSAEAPLGPWSAILRVAIACVALYAAGMALNDLLDRTIDASERPHRPFPSGRATPAGVLVGVVALVALALSLLATVSLATLAAGATLVLLIVAYDVVHARTAWSVLFMGSCRAMTYLVAASIHGVPERPATIVGPAFLLLLFVAAFSVVARREASGAKGPLLGPAASFLSLLLLPAALLVPGGLEQGGMLLAATLTLALCIVAAMTKAALELLHRPPRIPAAIALFIATIALYDGYLLLLAGSLSGASLAIACFIATRIAQRRIAGT
jgi:4-hydroxybenzoate polyprenyltransferase